MTNVSNSDFIHGRRAIRCASYVPDNSPLVALMLENSVVTGKKTGVVLCCVVCTFHQHVTRNPSFLVVYDRYLCVNYVWVVYNLPFETDHLIFIVKWQMIEKWMSPSVWGTRCSLHFSCFGGLHAAFRGTVGFRDWFTFPATTFPL
jgi:hypothetical protein